MFIKCNNELINLNQVVSIGMRSENDTHIVRIVLSNKKVVEAWFGHKSAASTLYNKIEYLISENEGIITNEYVWRTNI